MTLEDRLTNPAPLDYSTPPWPSLYWPLGEKSKAGSYLYYTHDIWLFTLLWTLIMYAVAHGIVAAIAVLMQIGKGHHFWLYAWAIPLVHVFIAGSEAVMAGSVVGLILGAVYESGYLRMSTWIPFIWGLINVLFLILSSFSFDGGL